MKHLIIAGKPSVAREIAQVLGAPKKEDGHENDRVIVTSAHYEVLGAGAWSLYRFGLPKPRDLGSPFFATALGAEQITVCILAIDFWGL